MKLLFKSALQLQRGGVPLLDIDTIITIVQTSAIAIGGLFAARTYMRDSSLKRVEWLERLHEKFYVEDTYKYVRQLLDYESEDDFSSFQSAISSRKWTEEQEQLVDYLNFFHFISAVWTKGHLKQHEIKLLFDYYLGLLVKHDFLVQYMQRENFDNLLNMLTKFGYFKDK